MMCDFCKLAFCGSGFPWTEEEEANLTKSLLHLQIMEDSNPPKRARVEDTNESSALAHISSDVTSTFGEGLLSTHTGPSHLPDLTLLHYIHGTPLSRSHARWQSMH